MRAVQFEKHGPPSALVLADVPTPTPGPGEVLVEIKAAAINPSDVKNVQGLMPHTTLPRTPGRDFSGVVVEGPTEMIGREVWGSGGELGFTRDGTHAVQIVLPREAVSPKPHNLSFEEAASVGVPYVTAWAGLINAVGLAASDTVLVTGAAGAVGSSAVQIAVWRGARVLGVVRRESQRPQVEQYGAQALVCADPAALAGMIQAATEGRGADIVFDTVGGTMMAMCLTCLTRRGRQVEIAASERQVSFDLLDFYRRELRLFGVNTLSLTAADGARILSALAPGFESGALHSPPITERYALSDAVHAYERVRSGTVPGKVILLPD